MMWKKLFRRKLVDEGETSKLKRVLSTLDLTLLGIGCTLGTGIYVLAGQVARMNAGPGVIISFLIAAFASVLAGLCYAEFGARVPKSGSAYIYSYVCIGEIVAFAMGWNLIKMNIIGVSSVAKAMSVYVDSFIPNHAMSQAFQKVGVFRVSFLGEYFDFFAFGIVILLTLLLSFGVKESSVFNNILTSLNLLVVMFVIGAGAIFAKPGNWDIDPSFPTTCKNISSHHPSGKIGDGGFLPFGFQGVINGAVSCFYGFIGFDVIATTGEEAKNPKKAIPISIFCSLLFTFLAYFGISVVLTMMLPYYCQDEKAPLPFAFQYVGFSFGRWVVTIGALFAFATSMLGSGLPLTRIVYSMAGDGLLCEFLGYVHPYFQTPIWATLIGGIFAAFVGAIFDLSTLIEMMSIVTLAPYIFVSLCVIILRYRQDESEAAETTMKENDDKRSLSAKLCLRLVLNLDKPKLPTKSSSSYAAFAAINYCVVCIIFCGISQIEHRFDIDLTQKWKWITFIAVLTTMGLFLILTLFSLALQPVSRTKLSFKVPMVPWIPGLGILINTYLILTISSKTWIAFAVWMTLGIPFYVQALASKRLDIVYEDSCKEYYNHMTTQLELEEPLHEETDEAGTGTGDGAGVISHDQDIPQEGEGGENKTVSPES